jgi:hypothetical protein
MPEVTTKPSLTERINVRMIIFAAVVLLIVGYPAWVYIDSEISNGIHNAGNGYKSVDLKQMSSFSFDQNVGRLEDIPQKWRDLNGQKVILVGEMWAPNAAGPTTDKFDLCYSIQKCCFSGPPQVQHFVNARPVKGLSPNFNTVLVQVKGTLHVNVKSEEGKIASVYQLDVESVEPVM